MPIETRTPKRTLGILSKPLREHDNTSRVFIEYLTGHFADDAIQPTAAALTQSAP